jgi:hypothetical protein
MEIAEIKLLSNFFAKYRFDFLSPADLYFSDKNHPELLRLYKEIFSGKVTNDQQAAENILQTSATNIEYLKLKNELEQRLVNLVFGLDPEKLMNSMLGRSFFRSYIYFGAAMLLRQQNESALLSDTFFKRAADYASFAKDGLITCLTDLMLADRMAIKNRPDDFYHYKNKFKQSFNQFKLEAELNLMQRELDIFQLASNIAQYKNAAKAKRYYLRAKKIHQQLQTFYSNFYYGNIAFVYGYFSNNFKLIEEVLNEREAFYQKHPEYFSDFQKSFIALSRMLACIHLRQYDKGKEEARIFLQKLNTNSVDWLHALEHYFILCMHSGNFEQALNIYFEATKSEYFNNSNPEVKERWHYFEPYLNFILPDHFPKDSINLLGFLDEISYYTSHKEDNNIIIMIGQIIVMIEMGEWDKLYDRTNYLDTYIKKYVEKRIYPRTYIFLKMLLVLFKNNFQRSKTEKQTNQQLQKLLPVADNKWFNTEGLEIIPYEKLWVAILAKLKRH